MSKYFNRYSHATRPAYKSIVEQSNSSFTYAIGDMGSSGIMSLLSSEGTALYSKTYSIGTDTVKFVKAIETANGEFVLFGYKTKSTSDALIMRLRADGVVIWSNYIVQPGATDFIDMIKVGTDDYVILTKINNEDLDTFELVKFSGAGTVLGDFQATVSGFNIAPEGLENSASGFMVYGGTDINSNWDAFYAHFNTNLGVIGTERVGNSRYQYGRAMLHIGADKFVVSGEHDTSRESFIFEYRPGTASYSANIMDICTAVADEGIKRLQLLDATADDYLLYAQNDATTNGYFCIFNSSYAIQSRNSISNTSDYFLKDMLVHEGETDAVRAVGIFGNAQDQGLALRTDEDLILCCISDESLPTVSSKTFNSATIELEGSTNERSAVTVSITVTSETFTKNEECEPSTVDISGDWLSQSPYLYLQAAGSDGVDETVKGFHLRWDLKGVIGESHFPKGNLSGAYGTYPATYGFNKPDDFVKIYRSAFVNDYYTKVDFSGQPSSYNVGGAVREWHYNNLSPQTVQGGSTMNVIVSFPDTAAYDAQAGSTPPTSSTINFLKNYSGEIDVQLDGKLAFRMGWSFSYVNSGDLSNAVCRHEFVGLTDSTDTNSEELRYRKTFVEADFASAQYSVCEDIFKLRFDRVNAYPDQLQFYCYEDYILGINQSQGWSLLSQYSLTEDQTTAYKRLEDSSAFDIDGKWPKFNDDDSGTGKFKVNVDNYEDRWSKTNGIASGVNKYLTLSQSSSNELAVESIAVTPKGQLQSTHEQELSYFNMLGIASLDYHVSRMLGFGHIDPMSSAQEEDQYVYLAEYNTEGDLQDGLGTRDVKHIYMTPHQTIMDFKHAEVPKLQNPVTYGLAFDNGSGNPSQLTDVNGYTPFADIRFVNLNREAYQFEQPFQTFFQESDAFSFTAAPQPVGFGVEYKEQGGTNVAPELSHDKVYIDNAQIPETNLIPNTGNNPLLRHQETNEGIHCYQLYSVNWFSRTAGLSNSVCTDETIFPDRNTIAPPANLSVHLIQPESPTLLTTVAEQTAYDGLSGDKTYLRTLFDWNYIQNKAYQFADKAEFFFHKQEKLSTKGEISAITPLSNHRLELTTTSYSITSTQTPETVTPTIPQTLEASFENSLIAINGLNYRVESIVNTSGSSGENPKIIIHQIKETNSVETVTGSNAWATTETYVSPSVGDRFLISENLTVGANWDNKLQKSLFLETFSTNDTLNITGSTNNDGTYSIDAVAFNTPNTVITVLEDVNDTVNDGSITVQLRFPSKGFMTGNNGFLIDGDVTSYFGLTSNVKIKGAILNDGDYTIDSVQFNSTQTEVKLNETLDLTSSIAYLYLTVQVAVVDYDATAKTVAIAGDYSSLIIPTYKEERQNTDGTQTTIVVGGVTGACTITEYPDKYSSDDVANGYGTLGADIPGSKTGTYEITFSGNPLPDHIDPDVTWFRGKVRVIEDDTQSFLPTPNSSRTTPIMKELDVSYFEEVNGDLVLYASDPTFQITRDLSTGTPFAPIGDYVPILTGSTTANYHPSYLLYLTKDTTGTDPNEFAEPAILPDLDEGSRQTFLGLRAIDSEKNDPLTDNLASRMSVPAAINAMEIREPQQPNEPSGPLYATRPDFYGKSTYTMDIGFPNNITEPYSVLLYKSNARKVLDQLYTPGKADEIMDDLAAFGFDVDFYDRWNKFVNLSDLDGAGNFPTVGGYQFPTPNNTNYTIPLSETTANPVQPFDGVTPPGDSGVVFGSMTMFDVVKEAIETAFVSQTREPMIYQHLKKQVNVGEQTSSAPPKLRDDNGDRLKPTDSAYNAHPNAIQMTNGDLRFTDYNIDGGAIDFYFYYGMELSDRQEKSEASPILGPVQVINTRPAKKPNVKKVVTIVENPALQIDAAVCFKLEEYVTSERITRIDIYRAIDPLDAITTRTMDLAASVDVSGGIPTTEICDTFQGLDFPLYGEELYYRLVALREVTLEDGVSTEFIPSEASEIARATLADPINPPAPCITSENGTTTATELQNVILKWDQQCYNGTYRLQKMNSSGNWVKIYSIKSNDDVMQYPPLDGGGLPDFTNFPETAVLEREDANGTAIYHRFRVQVENSSGLFNLSDCPRVLATGDFDLQVLTDYLSYSDDHGFTQGTLVSAEVDDGANNNPTSMTFTANVPTPLPAGHNSFGELEITVTDDQGNTYTDVIGTPTGSVTFVDGSGGLLLDEANHTYTITTKLTTSLTTNGYKSKAILSYVHGPCNDLSNIAQILTVEDSTHTFDLTGTTVEVNDSSADAPGTLKFTDVSDVANLSIPQTFTLIDITVTDGLGNSETKQITSAGGDVTFDGTGGLIINDGDTNREFSVSAVLKTTQCSTGETFDYSLSYTYDPYVELQEMTDVVSYADQNAASINPLVSQNVDNDVHNPGGQITIANIIGAGLPSNHTLDEIDVTLYDGIGGTATKTITPPATSVDFITGDGQTGSLLDLGATNPNPTIAIEVRVKTDLCPDGALFYYSLPYTYDPYVYLAAQTNIASFTDGNSYTVNPLYSIDGSGDPLEFNDSPGPGQPGTFTNPANSIVIADVSGTSLPPGDSFTSMEVTISDGIGGESIKTINTAAGSVSFTQADGIEVDGGSAVIDGVTDPTGGENRTYTIQVKLTTSLCPDGVMFVYSGRYTVGL